MARYIFCICLLMFGNFGLSAESKLPPFDAQIMAGHSPLFGVFGSLRLTKEFHATDSFSIGPTFDYAHAIGADMDKSSFGVSTSFRFAKLGDSSFLLNQSIFGTYQQASDYGHKKSRLYASGSTGVSALMFNSYGVMWGPKIEYFYSLKAEGSENNAILLGLVFSF